MFGRLESAILWHVGADGASGELTADPDDGGKERRRCTKGFDDIADGNVADNSPGLDVDDGGDRVGGVGSDGGECNTGGADETPSEGKTGGTGDTEMARPVMDSGEADLCLICSLRNCAPADSADGCLLVALCTCEHKDVRCLGPRAWGNSAISTGLSTGAHR